MSVAIEYYSLFSSITFIDFAPSTSLTVGDSYNFIFIILYLSYLYYVDATQVSNTSMIPILVLLCVQEGFTHFIY